MLLRVLLAGMVICLGVVGAAVPVRAADPLAIPLGYLERTVVRPPTLSNLVARPADEGVQGARLGITDNATTGRFMRHDYSLQESVVAPDGDFTAAARALLDGGVRLLVVNAPADDLLSVADMAEAAGAILFNAGSMDVELRGAACRANVFHTLPSRAMLADALMQFVAKRRWSRLMLVEGARPGDAAFADALRRSARKFGQKIVVEKPWLDNADIRRNASAEVPLFTQADAEVDLMVIADEDQDFGQYFLYNTWMPRPVAGSHGLKPVAWSRVVEQWGAAQLQSRFQRQAGRDMDDVDYAAWLAVRAVGEAVTRTKSNDPATMKAYMLSPDFALGGFKGASLSFRPWNHQMRQPIPLVHPEALVALAPIDGYLHRRTTLDTLGLDEPESPCKLEQAP